MIGVCEKFVPKLKAHLDRKENALEWRPNHLQWESGLWNFKNFDFGKNSWESENKVFLKRIQQKNKKTKK